MGQYISQQLAYSGPVLVVYLVGMILSLVFIRKYPTPAILTLAATLILFATSLGLTITQGYLISTRLESARSPSQFNQMQAIVTVIGAGLRTLGTALLVAAVFTGRKGKEIN